jgi:hypothetical protein
VIRGLSKLADHLTMVREVSAINPCRSAGFVEQPTSRTIRLPLRRAADDRSHTFRLKVFSLLLLRQKAPMSRNGRRRRTKMVQMVRELSPCGFDAYAMVSRSSKNASSADPPARSQRHLPAGEEVMARKWKTGFSGRVFKSMSDRRLCISTSSACL